MTQEYALRDDESNGEYRTRLAKRVEENQANVRHSTAGSVFVLALCAFMLVFSPTPAVYDLIDAAGILFFAAPLVVFVGVSLYGHRNLWLIRQEMNRHGIDRDDLPSRADRRSASASGGVQRGQ